jgi:hypothetical protein
MPQSAAIQEKLKRFEQPPLYHNKTSSSREIELNNPNYFEQQSMGSQRKISDSSEAKQLPTRGLIDETRVIKYLNFLDSIG